MGHDVLNDGFQRESSLHRRSCDRRVRAEIAADVEFEQIDSSRRGKFVRRRRAFCVNADAAGSVAIGQTFFVGEWRYRAPIR